MDHKEDRPWLSSIVQLRYHQNAVCAYGGAATYLNNRLWMAQPPEFRAPDRLPVPARVWAQLVP